MHRFLHALTAALALGGPASLDAQEPSVVGVWEIVELVDWSADGEPSQPFGADPNGYFVYTPEGRLILHILPDPLPSSQTPPFTTEEFAARARSSIAYFGTYSVDYERAILVHEVAGALSPNRAGGAYERPFQLDGDELVLDFTREDGRRFLRRLRRVETLGQS